MKNRSGLIWGLALIAVGVIWAGNALGLFNINLFFNGWWTLFIIVPCLWGLITESEKVGNLIGLLIGILLLLSAQNVISFGLIWRIFIPAVLVIIGLNLVFKNLFNRSINEEIKKLNKNLNKDDAIAAVFSGQKLNFDKEEFKGKNLDAIFGGIDLDLRSAKIVSDVVINASAIFGGIDIMVPENVKIKIKSNAIFGGVSDKTKKSEGKHTIYINATGIFGGVEIK
ncbi:hypothetical protein IKF34_01550 [Candidatus Saccharibacteria bacterium]|nr:hypothetical protein [Candidatus Saccharibacteria bacterium]